MEAKTSPEKIDTGYLDSLRCISTFAVIMIHIFAPINLYYSGALLPSEAYFCIILRNIWQWCVPVFVMITGVLFLNPEKEIPLEKLLKKYVLRIVLAIVLFGIPYCFMELLFDAQMSFNTQQIGTAIVNALQGKSWDHMWYLYMIAGLYLCIPLIRAFVCNTSKKVHEYTLMVLFIFTSFIPSLERIVPYTFGINIPINSVYVFYLLLGYYIHYNRINIKNRILWAILLCYILYAFLMPFNKNFFSQSNGGTIVLTGYNSPIVVLATISIFCLHYKNDKHYTLLKRLAPLCFGIYLIHPLIINFVYKYLNFNPVHFNVMYVIAVTTLATIGISIAFSYFARKIGILKKYVL